VTYDPNPTTTSTDKSFAWTLAVVSGLVVYAVLLTLHLSRDQPGTTAFQAGEVTPVPVLATILVGFLAPVLRRPHWPQRTMAVIIPSAIAVLAFAWYGVVHVVPDLIDDARAGANGQADYVLRTPADAGDWHRLDGKGVETRRDQVLAEAAKDPALAGVSDVVYGEYRGPQNTMLIFVGMNASGEFEDGLRESGNPALDDLMAGAQAVDVEDVDAGDLGGSMACANDVRDSPVGLAFCAWADASTVGQVLIFDADLGIEAAADLVREFRDHVTRR